MPMGTATSKERPTLGPKNPGGVTPDDREGDPVQGQASAR